MSRYLITGMLAGALLAGTVYAADVKVYRDGEIPKPEDIANIFNKKSNLSKPKMRGISLIEGEAAPAINAEKEVQQTAASSFAVPIRFAYNSSELLADAIPQLDAIAEGIKLSGEQKKIVVEGHTDASGSREFNENLSRRRAEAVKSYFVQKHGINPAQLVIVGRGKADPLVRDNPYAAENRRVQFRAADL